MIVKKVLNNSVILAQDEYEQEMILMGNAIGYHYKVGDTLPQDSVDKTFLAIHPNLNPNFLRILQETPEEYFIISQNIINYGREQIQMTLSDSIYVTLVDHINFVIKRYEKKLRLQNRLYWDIKRQYPNEFAVGEYACKLIYETLHIRIWDEEAANIALHFINAQNEGQTMEDTMLMAEALHDILLIITRHFSKNFDTSSLSYSRLTTHLQFFILRILEQKTIVGTDDFLYNQIKAKYPNEFKCVERIKEYVELQWDHSLEHDEMVYLCVHINRVMQEERN